ncbi:MAG TPA: hypothetical protein VIB07_08800 [Nitrososphaera sp.]|jgi:hypothetical protein
MQVLDLALAILPEGSVKDEGTFLMLVILLGAFVGVAVYLRIRNRGKEKGDPKD